MATTGSGFYPRAEEMRTMALLVDTGEAIIQLAIVNAIITAVTSGLRTATVSAGGTYTDAQIQNQMNTLIGLGYGVSYSGTTLTLTW